MAIEVKEEVSAVIFYKNIETLNAQESALPLSDYQPVSSAVSPSSIMTEIEGIHSIVTRNFTYYTPECLKKSAPYWTSPYERPIIMHHNDKNGVQIGRVKAAEYLEDTRAKAPGLLFTCNIGDEEGIKGVQNGTLSTVSIGAVIHKATCSICGQNIAAEGECEHQRGRKYDGELCYWLMEEMEPKELSYVIVPSDKYANTVKIYKPKNNTAKESYNEGGCDDTMGKLFDNIDLSMTEPEVEEVSAQEAQKDEAPAVEDVKDEPVQDKAIEEEPQKEEEEKKEEVKAEEESKEEKEEEKEMSKEELLDRNKQLEKQVADLLDDIKYLKAKLDKERGFKEALELELLQFKQANKLHLAEQIVELRKELGLREESIDDLMMRSEESLSESISTFMEFKESNTFNVNKLPKIQSQALVDDAIDNTSKEFTESENKEIMSNIDYEQQLDNWFMKNAHRKYFN